MLWFQRSAKPSFPGPNPGGTSITCPTDRFFLCPENLHCPPALHNSLWSIMRRILPLCLGVGGISWIPPEKDLEGEKPNHKPSSRKEPAQHLECGCGNEALSCNHPQPIDPAQSRQETRRHLLPAGIWSGYWVFLFETRLPGVSWAPAFPMSNHFRFTLWTCRIMLETWSREELSSDIQPGNAGQGLCFAIVQWHRLPFLSELEICYLLKRFCVLPLCENIIACFDLFVNLFFTDNYTF